jgi:glutamate carboxypeptidase
VETTQAVLAYLREHRPALVGFLERLALAESPSSEPRSQDEVLEILSEGFIEIGYEVRRIPGRESGGHLYARPERRHRSTQLLLGHCDTVWPLGTLDAMPRYTRGYGHKISANRVRPEDFSAQNLS